MSSLPNAAELFRHVSAERGARYRAILEVFASAKRQFRLQLRPEEVLAEADWPSGAAASPEDLAGALGQLVDWGNLEAQPDMARVTTLADYYRARYLYRLSHGGEAVEAAFERFAEAMARRAELQTVALEDIGHRLQALRTLIEAGTADVPKLHEILRDLVRVFEGLAENAQAFMAGVARSLELQRADATAVAEYKSRLIDYLERFVGDLVQRSEPIALAIQELSPRMDAVLLAVAEREARDAAPGASAGKGCAAGSSPPRTSRRKPSCCARVRARPFRSCWRRSPASTSAAADAATARPTSAPWPVGSPPARTISRRTASPRLRSR